MSVIQQVLTSELQISALNKHALAPFWTVCGQVNVKFLQFTPSNLVFAVST